MAQIQETSRPSGDVKLDMMELEQKTDIDVDDENVRAFRQFLEKDDEWHKKMTTKLMRKIDIHLIPLLLLMYLLNFLDRNNLSQARLGGLEDDLGMSGTDFNLATSILFVGYLLMQLPSNLLLTRLRPSMYLGSAMLVWGVISTCQAATRNFTDLVVCRFFLGFAEAPFFPGAVFLMSSWYTRSELTTRMAWFYSGGILANAFGGLIGAGVLGNLDGAHGLEGWRWLYIVEGSITMGAAIISGFILPDYPGTTRWLTEEEKLYAQWRLIEDAGEADRTEASGIKEGLMMALKDWRLYLFTLFQHCSLLSQTFQYFFPTIVQTLGFGEIETLLITAPVWIATFIVSAIVTFTSARYQDRGWHIVALMLVSVVGNIIVVSTLNTGARFVGMFLMPMGAVAAYQIILAWVANSFPRPLVKRSVCVAIANMIGNTANIYGPYMYPDTDGPRYLAGGVATAAVALVVAALAYSIRVVLKKQNKRLEEREAFEASGQTADQPGEMAPFGFRYVL